MPRLNRQRWWIASVLLCVIAGGITIWLGQRVLRPQQYLIARLEAELATTPTEELGIKLRQLAAFGEDGVPPLVRALKQPQREISDEARGVISEELDQWQILSHGEASRRLAKLAQALATDIESSDDNTRRICGDFATRLLLWPVDARAVDQQQLITDCERVLVSVRGERSEEAGQVRLAGAAFVPRAIDSQTTGGLSPLDDSLVIPGGDLPHDAVGVPSLPPGERSRPRMLPAGNDPHLSPVVNPDEEPRHLQSSASEPESYERDLLSAQHEDTLQLIYQLVSSQAPQRDAAEEVLRERGFGEAHLAVARKFADARPAVRQRLVEQLATQKVVDGKPWLLRLLEDRDSHVRLAAATVLSTSGDPQVVKRLRERALEENDPAVKSLLIR